ncbi:MAG: ElyC/SanA/YdcF family protein [Verrucomicrobiota bacterium]
MKRPSFIRQWIRRHFRLVYGFAFFLLFAVGWVVGANYFCQKAARNKIFYSTAAVPYHDVALVLGTGKLTRAGNPNWHFQQRMKAAAELFHAGKTRFILVSGDNHTADYDEPNDMRDALVERGVPVGSIICDYAGFRTLDSVVRAKNVFGLSRCTIISEEFHCPRALWIAQERGLAATAFAAPDLNSFRWGWRVRMREKFARAFCAVDLYLLHRQPKFGGPPEPILLTSNAR